MRRTVSISLLVIVGLLESNVLAPAAEDKPISEKRAAVRAKLARAITANFGKDTEVKDALEFLGDRYDLIIHFDRQVFERDIGRQVVSLPPQKNVPLGQVLERLLDPENARYVVQEGFIEVVPVSRFNPLAWLRKDFDRKKIPAVGLVQNPSFLGNISARRGR